MLISSILPAAISMSFSLPASAAAPAWPDTPVMRVEALALLQTLNAELLSHDSATLTLDRWCAVHHLAEGEKIVAERVKGADKPASEEVRRLLKVSAQTPLAYRHVRLKCGAHVLSEADNWYVPALLTPQMNRMLETTDTAFGRVVQPLQFQRHTVSAELLWQPLPPGWETDAAIPADTSASLVVPEALLRHHAYLATPSGTPFSVVVETYMKGVLGFAARDVTAR
ncbi:hypothetical protein [Rhizobium sp. CSW-27]|uniref:hypothetical protein n=1 Tax=Rhizobium sp. CSW-27 TaxID=2839985 RepID=UPI001C01B7DA|nr:hypothetical protein [Rhizobium sp. CSW-27]MBT9370214.1 hypothetical protein [Rhizobium sp. CSW-27]